MRRPILLDLVREMGPAWVVGAVACGPATLASVAIAGSFYGYSMLWVVFLSAVFALVAQYLAAKIGLLTGKGIIATVDEQLGTGWGWVLMVDALLATWLASTILMKALVDVTGLLTGFSMPWWAVVYGGLIFLLIGMGGYKVLERVCKALVSIVVFCFLMTVFVVAPNWEEVLGGMVPNIPAGVDSALMMAGIMGGAVHITIIGMHTYNVNARGWGMTQLSLARADVFASMFVAFGLYSMAIYLASATVLHPQGIRVNNALDLAEALKPTLGPYAHVMLVVGIWGAVISTIIPTFLAAGYFMADKMKWPLNVKDAKFRTIVLAGCTLSILGPLFKGSFLVLLVLMLALGLCGTPLLLLILLILLNRGALASNFRNGILLNVFGGLVFLITSVLALRFLGAKLGLIH